MLWKFLSACGSFHCGTMDTYDYLWLDLNKLTDNKNPLFLGGDLLSSFDVEVAGFEPATPVSKAGWVRYINILF